MKMREIYIDLIPFMRRMGKLDESNINILTKISSRRMK